MPHAEVSIARILHALGDPKRRAMVEMLSRRPHSASYLAEALQLTLTGVGQHLQILESAKLVQTEKVGRTRVCGIEREGFKLLEQWIRELRSHWDRSFDQLEKLLDEE